MLAEPPIPLKKAQAEIRLAARAEETNARIHVIRERLGLDSRHEFRLKSGQADEMGQTHLRYRQHYNGVPIWGGEVVLHLDEQGIELSPTNSLFRPPDLNTSPVIPVKEILARVHEWLTPRGSYDCLPQAELVIVPEHTYKVLRTRIPGLKPNAIDVEDSIERYRLAFYVRTSLKNPLDGVVQADFLVDAETGELIRRWNGLHTEGPVTNLGRSRFNGAVNLSVLDTGGAFVLRDPLRGEGGPFGANAITDMGLSYNGNGTVFSDTDGLWGDGANYRYCWPTGEENGQTTAVDAAFGIQAVWDYFLQIHGRKGIDGKGTATHARVHFGMEYANAFWDDECFCMTIGDGYLHGQALSGFATLDVMAHEFSHGVCSNTAGLAYLGESGGLNEANSDIFGTMVEFHARSGGGSTIGDTGGNWTIGEQIFDGGLRSMIRPSKDGHSADAWFPELGNLDVHYSSGPMNRAFFFLCEGASADSASESFSEYLPSGMHGIGKDKAIRIWYRAIEAYLTFSSGYREARQACLRASADLFGIDSIEFQAVQNTFAAINVGLPSGGSEDIFPPTVQAAVDGGTGQILLKAQAQDNLVLNRVSFFLDGIGVGTVTSIPYVLSIDSRTLKNGTHELLARAVDTAGNWGESSAVRFSVSNDVSECLSDPSFEGGGIGWRFTPGLIYRGYPTWAKRGQAFALLGGQGLSHSQFLEQDVELPANVAGLTLRFWINVSATADLRDVPLDILTLRVVDPLDGAALETLKTYSNCTGSMDYESQRFDLSAYAGRKIRLRFEAKEDEEILTSFSLDEFSLTSVSRDLNPPSVSLYSEVSDGIVHCYAQVDDDAGLDRVEFFLDGALKGTIKQPPYRLDIDTRAITDGSHIFTARAWDRVGHSTLSASNAVPIDNTPPQVVPSIVWEGNGYATFRADVTDSGSIQNVWFLVDSQYVGWLSWAPYECRFQIASLDPGPHTLSVVARDAAGNQGIGVRAFNIENPDKDLPVVTIYTALRSSEISIYASASDNVGVVRMEIYLNSVLRISQQTSSLNSVTFTLPSEGAGPHFLIVKAYDKAGNIGIATYTFGFDTTAPTVTASVTGGAATIALSGSATDASGVETLQFYLDNRLVREVQSSAASCNYDSRYLSNGEHVLEVRAKDKVGNIGSASQQFTVSNPDTTPPIVTLRLDRVDGKLRAIAEIQDVNGAARVDYTVDGNSVGTSTEAPSFPLLVDVATLGPADHTIQATAYDPSGNSGKSTVYTFSGDSLAPTLRAWIEEDVSQAQDVTLFQAEVTDDRGVRAVSFQVDDDYPTVIENSPYVIRKNSIVYSNGPHRLQVKAWDAAGNTSTTDQNFIVVHRDRTPPFIKDVWPQYQEAGLLKVWAGLYDSGGVARVAMYMDGIFLGDASPDATDPIQVYNYSLIVDATSMSEGLHTLNVQAWDLAGNASEPSHGYTLIVDHRPPTGVQVFQTTTNGIWFWALAHDFSAVEMEYLVDGISVGSPPKYDRFQGGLTFRFWYGAPDALAYGQHKVVARAWDLGGNHTDSEAVAFDWIPTQGSPVTAPLLAPQGAAGLSASAPPPPNGVRYRWRVTNGTLRSSADQTAITFDAGIGPYTQIDLETIYPGGEIRTSGAMVFLSPLNLDLDRDGGNPDPLDMAVFVNALGTVKGESRYSAQLDLNSDDRIDERDLELFLALLGK